LLYAERPEGSADAVFQAALLVLSFLLKSDSGNPWVNKKSLIATRQKTLSFVVKLQWNLQNRRAEKFLQRQTPEWGDSF